MMRAGRLFLAFLGVALVAGPNQGFADAKSGYTRNREPMRIGARQHRRVAVARKSSGGFFDKLFGGSTGRAVRRGVKPLFESLHIGTPFGRRAPVSRQPAAVRSTLPVRPRLGNDGTRPRFAAGRPYRALCVRLCDGYYYPMSFQTGRDNFATQDAACASSCNAPAKLFVYANPGQSVDDMLDLDGNAYRDLANAFRYRKEYVADCRCRADPWSVEARERHAAYAAAEEDADNNPQTQAATEPEVPFSRFEAQDALAALTELDWRSDDMKYNHN